MDGYSNLASSPPAAAAASGHGAARAPRPSMELTNTKETKAWEGLAIGAVTLARTFSTGSSHRFRRSGSERRGRSRSGLPGALRRAFSMRRYHPAGPGCGAGDGYWRIHDMDGDMMSDYRGDDTVVEEHGSEDEAAREEAESKKQAEQRDEDGAAAAADAAAGKEDAEGRPTTTAKKQKKRGGILKTCKKLFRL